MLFEPLGIAWNGLIFAAAAAVVWFCGTKLSLYVARIARRNELGQAFAGMLILGAITSLPELAGSSTAAAMGNASLATSAIFGSIATNIVLLAFADALIGRDAITSTVGKPTTLLQGTFTIALVAMIAAGTASGEVAIPVVGIGVWSVAILPVYLLGLRLAAQQDRDPSWKAADGKGNDGEDDGDEDDDDRLLYVKTVAAGAGILVSGFLLASSGEAIAESTGLGAGLFGFVLIAFATSLPEVSTITASVRRKNYSLAIGDVFGTNLFNLALIPIADAFYRKGPLLAEAGPFELVSALIGIVLIAIIVVGLIERRDRAIWRMGYDTIAVLIVYAIGLAVLATVPPPD